MALFDHNWWHSLTVIASGGVTSAVACYLAIKLFGLDNCFFIMMDTKNEDIDTYRFKYDCEQWYGKPITAITGLSNELPTIQDVWYQSQSLNVAHGAICSSTLKRDVRLRWERENSYKYQIFGFDIDETKRAKSMTLNYPTAKTIYPLLLHGYSKKICIEILEAENIEIPRTYKLGFHNNNCFQTGCVQGGIGYWQKMYREFPDKFNAMAKVEHDLTDLRGEQVTMCKHQSNEAKKKPFQERLLFLKAHPNYPKNLTVLDVKAREPKPLVECNGFCATNDLLKRSKTEEEIYQLKIAL